LGSVVGQGSQVGFGLTSLKYSRKYETQADILGAQIMARAGYDPHDLANVFKLLESQGGPSGPQFLSDHQIRETDSSESTRKQHYCV